MIDELCFMLKNQIIRGNTLIVRSSDGEEFVFPVDVKAEDARSQLLQKAREINGRRALSQIS